MSTTTVLNDLQEAMKVIFADPLVENIVTDAELLNLFQTEMNVQTDVTAGGRYIEMAHYFQLPAAVGARNENEYIPVPGNPVFKNSRIYLKKIQGSIEMTGDTMRRVVGNPGAFIDYAARALTDLGTRMVHELDRMYVGTGSGIIGRVAAGGVSGGSNPYTVPLDRLFGITGLGDVWPVLLEGMTLRFSANADGSSPRTMTGTVVGFNETTGNVYVNFDATPSTIVANDYTFAGDASQLSAGGREITGLYAAVDDGSIVADYHNIDRTDTDTRQWRGVVIAAGATAPLTEDRLIAADDTCFLQGGGKVDTVVTSRAQIREYWKDLKGDRRLMNPGGSYTGGKSGVEVILGDRSLLLKASRKLPKDVCFGLQRDTFGRVTLGSFEWDDTTGAIWNRVTDSTGRKDAFYAVGNLYEELLCKAPRKNFRIDGLDVT